MTPPIPGPESKLVYVDPREQLHVHHIVVAAALVAMNHELLWVDARPSAKLLFVFRKSAERDHDRLRRLIDEMDSERQRARQKWQDKQGRR